jgi:hypothetical protein
MLDWVDDYNRAHGHGPSWRVYRAEPALWPTEVPRPVQDAVLTLLSLAGDLNGTKTPYALRCRIHPAAEPTAPTPRQRTADALCSESAWSR